MTDAPESHRLGAADYQAKRGKVLDMLREVAILSEDTGAATLAKKLRDDRIPRLEEEKFHLVVLGEFNHGKTTFVNALLGAPVLPMGVTPTTAVIHQVVHGVRGAKAIMESGESKIVPFDEVGSYVVGGSATTDAVRYLEVHYPSALLNMGNGEAAGGGVVLVDTPGVNDLNSTRAEITYSYVPKADAILFLLDAGQILKESERTFLANKLLSQSRDKVLFVINKIDLLDEDEKQQALSYAKTQLAKLVVEPRVYAVSAEKALAGEREASGLGALERDLVTFLEEDRGRVLLDNALDEGLRTAVTLRRGMDVQKQALLLDHGELEKRLATLEQDLSSTRDSHARREQKIRESLAGIKALVRKECEEFGKRFSASLPAEIESSKADDLKRYLPNFMEERFRNFADRQGLELAKRLERVAEEAIAFVSEEARAKGEKIAEAFPGAPKVDLQVSTLAYDVGVIALGAFGLTVMAVSNIFVGGAMALAAPVLAYVFRERADRDLKKRAMEEAPQAVEKAAGDLATAFEQQIDEFGDKLVDFVKNASEELTQSMAEVVRHAKVAQQRGEGEVGRVREETGMALSRLGIVEQEMGALRTSLWANGSGAAPN
ncbi:MAG: dynamin family protein [Deltaproteobacteria bacterium]|nr:dynamin family protein [Deltaproteobacteria bacterium]